MPRTIPPGVSRCQPGGRCGHTGRESRGAPIRPNAVLRPATPDDAGRLAAVARAAYERYLARMDVAPAPVLADYDALVRTAQVTVAEVDGQVVGFVATRDQGPRTLLENVAVLPARHGQGIGRLLVDRAEREARRRGSTAIVLYTNEAMTENLALYPRLGYVETGRRQEGPYRRVHFEKRLPAEPSGPA